MSNSTAKPLPSRRVTPSCCPPAPSAASPPPMAASKPSSRPQQAPEHSSPMEPTRARRPGSPDDQNVRTPVLPRAQAEHEALHRLGDELVERRVVDEAVVGQDHEALEHGEG